MMISRVSSALQALALALACGTALAACIEKPPLAAQDKGQLWLTGHACTKSEECDSNACVEFPSGFACASTCTSDCPAALVCKRARPREPQVSAICVPPTARLCQPCAGDESCGAFGDLCVPLGNGSKFCALDCSVSASCPEGFGCESVRNTQGDVVAKQCLPKSGTCTCEAANAGMHRPCLNSVAGIGACAGEEVCDPEVGWTGCDAPAPARESCDGEDNDCDSEIDEASPGTPLIAQCTYGPTPARPECAGLKRCTKGAFGACSVPVPSATEVKCDGLDDNCDGQIDEGLLHTPGSCASCSDVCPPADPAKIVTTVRSCDGGAGTYTCGMKCQVPFFDVNADPADGCEIEDDHTLSGDSVVLNYTEASAFLLNGPSMPLTLGGRVHSCGLRLPSDIREHVPNQPPTPRTDWYVLADIGVTLRLTACARAVARRAEDADAELRVCVSAPLPSGTPASPSGWSCTSIQGTAVPLVTLPLPEPTAFLSTYYVTVTSQLGPFAGTYALMLYDQGATCTLATGDDPCTY